MSTHETWHAAKMANDHQDIIIEDITGRNVAVVYDRTDTALLAAAPELLEALRDSLILIESIRQEWEATHDGEYNPLRRKFEAQARAAIAKAEGRI